VWWQGSELGGFTTASLMAGTKSLSKRYFISKQFFRFIRPGASMVKATSADSAVLALAFEHVAMGSFTAILINSSSQQKSISLTGANVPTTLTLYTTSATDNCVNNGTVNAASITLAPNTVNTLVFGNVYESGSSTFVGATSSGDAGGASGSGGAIGIDGQGGGSGGSSISGGVTGSGGITSSGGIASSGGIISSGSGGFRGSGGFKGAGSDAGVGVDTGAGGDKSVGGNAGIIGTGGATGLAPDAGVPVAGAGGSIDGGADASDGFRGNADASSSANKSSGCSCHLGTNSNSSVAYHLGPIGLVLPIGFVLWRRRRRSSPG
jgi:hypothetical protein